MRFVFEIVSDFDPDSDTDPDPESQGWFAPLCGLGVVDYLSVPEIVICF
jgi:hypothetical protein